MRKTLGAIAAGLMLTGCGGASQSATTGSQSVSTASATTSTSSQSSSAAAASTPAASASNTPTGGSSSAMYEAGQSMGTELVASVFLEQAAKAANLSKEQVTTFANRTCALVRESASSDEIKPKAQALRNEYNLSNEVATQVTAIALAVTCPDLVDKVKHFK